MIATSPTLSRKIPGGMRRSHDPSRIQRNSGYGKAAVTTRLDHLVTSKFTSLTAIRAARNRLGW
jgi:hypothetical protein